MHSRRARRTRVILVLTAAFAVVIGGWLTFQAVAQPSEPSAFYTPPTDLPDGPPGTLIRSERAHAPVPGERAWRILYTSTGLDGTPIAVSGVVVAPDMAAPDGGWPVLAWAHGSTGIAPRCAPSMEKDAGIPLVPEYRQLIDAGTVVTITDYPGLGTPGTHPYLVGESEGRAVLDSIRAARQLLAGETNDANAIFGHSQGGHAALFAGQIAPAYAPELHIRGVAAMAPPTDLAALLRADDHESSGIVLTALALRSWSTVYPDADESAILGAPARELVDDLATRCIETTAQGLTDVADIAGLKIEFLAIDPTTTAGWAEHFSANSLGDLPTSVPVLVTQGQVDDIVRPDVTAGYVAAQCDRGVPIELDAYAGTGHFAVRSASAVPVATWLLARLAGPPAATGCSTVPVNPEHQEAS